jgi:diacylglycerol kinase (ATP)
MRAAAIFGPGSSPASLELFQKGSPTRWQQELPAATADADAIVIFGGDGTIHRHLAAIVQLQLPVLTVPSGSANDFARALNLRSVKDSLRAWRSFESGKTQPRRVDLGVITPAATPEHKHYFCCVAGCGLDAAAAKRANQMPRWLRGHGGYALALLPLLLKLPSFSMRLTQCDGTHTGDEVNDGANNKKLTLLAAFANTPFFGDGMRIAPNADFTDGQLDICRISTMNAFELFCTFPTVYFGWHLLSPKVNYSRALRAQLQTVPVTDIYADGEFVCETPAEISIEPGALQVICPLPEE